MSPLKGITKLPGILGELDRAFLEERATSRLTHYLAELRLSPMPREAIIDRIHFIRSRYHDIHKAIKGGMLTEEGQLLGVIFLIANYLEQRDIMHYQAYEFRAFGDDFANCVESSELNRAGFLPLSYRKGITHTERMDIKEVAEIITDPRKTESMLEASESRQYLEMSLLVANKTLSEIFPEDLV